MSEINYIVLSGYLARSADLRYTNSGKAVSNFSIAVNKRIKSNNKTEETVSFFECTVWGKYAETIYSSLQKGKHITVEGELKQEHWKNYNKENRSSVKIIVNNIRLPSVKQQKAESGKE